MAKIKMKRPAEAITLESAFKEFVIAQSAKGVAEKTLKTYHSHFHAAGKHIDIEKLSQNFKNTTSTKWWFQCVRLASHIIPSAVMCG